MESAMIASFESDSIMGGLDGVVKYIFAKDKAGFDNFRRDQHTLGAADVLLQPGHFGVAHEILKRRVGGIDQLLLFGLRKRRTGARSEKHRQQPAQRWPQY